jgi:hypothetical protein
VILSKEELRALLCEHFGHIHRRSDADYVAQPLDYVATESFTTEIGMRLGRMLELAAELDRIEKGDPDA